MNKLLRVVVLCLVGISSAYAEQYQVLHFEQAIDLKPEENMTLEVKPMDAGAQFWIATVIVANQGLSDRQASMQVQMQPTGAVNKQTPTEKITRSHLVAGNLLRQDQASFEQFDQVIETIQAQQPKTTKILPTTLEPTDPVRVYAEITDWVPQYDHQGAIQFKLSVPEQNGFYPSGVYVFVGQGDYPKQLQQWAKALPEKDETQLNAQATDEGQLEIAVDSVKSFTGESPEPIEETSGTKTFMVQLGFLSLLIVSFILWRKRKAG